MFYNTCEDKFHIYYMKIKLACQEKCEKYFHVIFGERHRHCLWDQSGKLFTCNFTKSG